MSRARREPTEDELTLWRYVTRDVTPQQPHPILRTARHPSPEPDAPPPVRAPEQAPAAPASRPQSRPTPLALGATAGIDRRTAQRFGRGQIPIEARLDLHGKTVRDAHDAVDRFLRRAAHGGLRCVLIVTGKGGGTSETKGRIRGEAMHWLDHPALRPLILAVREARSRDGGAGALYVLLKRQRP